MPNPPPGTYYEPVPVDFLILAKLPDAGMLGGVHWKGRLAKDDHDEITAKELDGDATLLNHSLVMSRMRSMHAAGFVNSYSSGSVNGLKVWARTPAGAEHLARKDEILGAVLGTHTPTQTPTNGDPDGSV